MIALIVIVFVLWHLLPYVYGKMIVVGFGPIEAFVWVGALPFIMVLAFGFMAFAGRGHTQQNNNTNYYGDPYDGPD